jgi:hypothetical protein
MAVQRINFTNRKRLTREQANVAIRPDGDGGPATFDAILDLSLLAPAADAARVFVEAYHQSTRMRFDFGTVALVKQPALRRLHEFPDWRDVRFRVKVTDVTGSPGRIVALADRIKPKGPDDNEEPDLVRFKDADLDGLLWDVDFDDEGPIVLVERTAGGAQKLGRDDHFIAAAFPEVLRRALERALVEDKAAHDDSAHWFKLWFDGYFVPKLALKAPPPADQESGRRQWITNAVNLFARRFQMASYWAADDGAKLGEKKQ